MSSPRDQSNNGGRNSRHPHRRQQPRSSNFGSTNETHDFGSGGNSDAAPWIVTDYLNEQQRDRLVQLFIPANLEIQPDNHHHHHNNVDGFIPPLYQGQGPLDPTGHPPATLYDETSPIHHHPTTYNVNETPSYDPQRLQQDFIGTSHQRTTTGYESTNSPDYYQLQQEHQQEQGQDLVLQGMNEHEHGHGHEHEHGDGYGDGHGGGYGDEHGYGYAYDHDHDAAQHPDHHHYHPIRHPSLDQTYIPSGPVPPGYPPSGPAYPLDPSQAPLGAGNASGPAVGGGGNVSGPAVVVGGGGRGGNVPTVVGHYYIHQINGQNLYPTEINPQDCVDGDGV